MTYTNIIKQTPNYSKGREIKPTGIIFHHTAGSYIGSVSWCLDPVSKVSYHCIVDLNGNRTVLAKDTHRCWHAGISSFKEKSDCNSFMLGIAVSGDTTKRELNINEIKSVAQWTVGKMKLFNIPIENLTTHRHVSVGRKNDVDIRAERAIMEEIKNLLK